MSSPISLRDYRARNELLELCNQLDGVLEKWKLRDERYYIYHELQSLKWIQIAIHDRLRRLSDE